MEASWVIALWVNVHEIFGIRVILLLTFVNVSWEIIDYLQVSFHFANHQFPDLIALQNILIELLDIIYIRLLN